MLKKARLLTRPTLATTSLARPDSAKTASSPRDAPYPMQGRSSAADPRFTFHASRFTVLGSEARTPLADFFSILLDHRPPVEQWRKTGDRNELSERGGRHLRTRLGTMNEMGDAKFFCRNQTTLIIIHVEGPYRIESQ